MLASKVLQLPLRAQGSWPHWPLWYGMSCCLFWVLSFHVDISTHGTLSVPMIEFHRLWKYTDDTALNSTRFSSQTMDPIAPSWQLLWDEKFTFTNWWGKGDSLYRWLLWSGLHWHNKIFEAVEVIKRKGLFSSQLLRFKEWSSAAAFCWERCIVAHHSISTCLSELKAQILSQEGERERENGRRLTVPSQRHAPDDLTSSH